MKFISPLLALRYARGRRARFRLRVLDLSTIKCKEFVESSKENDWPDPDVARRLLQRGRRDKAIIDFDKMKRKGEKLAVYCGANPDARPDDRGRSIGN